MLGSFPVTLSAPGTPGPLHVANRSLPHSRWAR
jgi:hypothetical protein